MTELQVYKRCAEIAMQASSGPDAANRIIFEASQLPCRRKNTLIAVVRAMSLKFNKAFHMSDLIQSVLKVMPEANVGSIKISVFHLTHRDSFLKRLRHGLYQVVPNEACHQRKCNQSHPDAR